MHARMGKATQRMDFFIDRQAAPTDGQRGPQQLPAAVRCQVRPVHDDQRLRQRAEDPAGQYLIQGKALGSKMPVAEQPIDALDAVLHARCTPERAA